MRRPLLVATSLVAAACMTQPARTTSSGSASVAGPAAHAAPLGAREREVLDVVQRLFDAMRAGDSAAARALFEPRTTLQSVASRQGVLTVSEDSVGMFMRAIGTPHAQVYDERIANERVLIDGPYAVAWVDYTFYLGDQKSHCGIDAFQMVRRPAGWRIFGLTDTRRRENCPNLPRR
jgi:putative lumazine-binding protein